MREFNSIDVRPYQLMLAVSTIASGAECGDPALAHLIHAVRDNPSVPLTLRCPVTTNYSYQNPTSGPSGQADWEFYSRCDLKILQKMGLTPGDTRPAVELFHRLFNGVETALGLLYFDEITSETWKGMDRTQCFYDKGRTLGLQAIFPSRDAAEMARFKVDSVTQMLEAQCLQIRPHHLLCMCCFFARGELEPIPEDNLCEAIRIIQAKPDIPIELICGPCMICPPCHNYVPSCNHCVSSSGMALRDELKDLEVLQVLGLKYGDICSATDLYTRLFKRVHSTRQICGYGDGVQRCPEFSVCQSAVDNASYAKARSAGLGFLKCSENLLRQTPKCF